MHTPPSLFSLFENFDCCLKLGRPPQGGAGGGLLVGIELRGIPLARAPVLEVHGPSQLLYSSADEDEDGIVSFLEGGGFLGAGSGSGGCQGEHGGPMVSRTERRRGFRLYARALSSAWEAVGIRRSIARP